MTWDWFDFWLAFLAGQGCVRDKPKDQYTQARFYKGMLWDFDRGSFCERTPHPQGIR